MLATRREAMGVALAALVPSWVRRTPAAVPLGAFCAPAWDGANRRYDFTRPFVQAGEVGLSTYATDSRIAVRVGAGWADRGADAGRLPPAAGLPWPHDALGGWRRWPAERPLVAAEADCPACDGFGTATGRPGPECRPCDGFGCTQCDGHGFAGPRCRACRGKGVGTHPAFQEVGSEIVAVKYDRLVRRHLRDAEYAVVPFGRPGFGNVVAVRFDGGCGLLMPVHPSERYRIVGEG